MRNKQVEFNPYIFILSKLSRFGYEISVFKYTTGRYSEQLPKQPAYTSRQQLHGKMDVKNFLMFIVAENTGSVNIMLCIALVINCIFPSRNVECCCHGDGQCPDEITAASRGTTSGWARWHPGDHHRVWRRCRAVWWNRHHHSIYRWVRYTHQGGGTTCEGGGAGWHSGDHHRVWRQCRAVWWNRHHHSIYRWVRYTHQGGGTTCEGGGWVAPWGPPQGLEEERGCLVVLPPPLNLQVSQVYKVKGGHHPRWVEWHPRYHHRVRRRHGAVWWYHHHHPIYRWVSYIRFRAGGTSCNTLVMALI